MITYNQMDDTGYWKNSPDSFRSMNPASQPDREPNRREHSSTSPETTKSPETISTAIDQMRFLIWADAVGGFLVCPQEEITIGQAVPHSKVDIPILGDITGKHLKLFRTSQGYLLRPLGYVSVNGVTLSEETRLKHGDEIELSGGIQLKFTKPHPLSASARLDFLSSHRTQPWSDAILLMAESFVFGPNMRNHVVCRDWEEDLVFFRRRDGLFCKSMGSITVDGVLGTGRTEIRSNSHIEGEDFSMTLEPIPS